MTATHLFDEWPSDCETQFWKRYPLRIGKNAAIKSLRKIRASGAVKWDKLINAVDDYSAWLAQRSPTAWRPNPKYASTWLNQACWDDELNGGEYGRPTSAQRARQLAERARELERERGLI